MMFAAAAVVRDDQGRTFYEHPDAFTTTQLVFFPRLTESELALYQADAIYEDEIEVLPRRRPQVPTILLRSATNLITSRPNFSEVRLF